jgi:YHS domain-containing protein
MRRGAHVATLALFALALAPTSGTSAADEKARQKFCPVMTTDEIDPENAYEVDYKGVKVLLCCNTCVAKFKRDPAAYLDTNLLPQLAGKELPKRTIEQVYCPVYKDRKVSAKDPVVVYKGVKIYVYNEVAKQRFEKDPARYADRKILPQLPKE